MRTLDDLLAEGVAGRRVLVRADLNVPLEQGEITDDGRIRASLPTLVALTEAGARVVVTAHLGRPRGAAKPELSLRPVAARLGELLGGKVELAGADSGGPLDLPAARRTVEDLADGQVTLLENVRFDARETSKDDAERGALAAELAGLVGDVSNTAAFVSDGFGVVHRKQASVYDVARLLPRYAGKLVLAELHVLRRLTGDPDRPYVVLLGGAKVSDKLAVIEALLPRVDALLVGGGMCFTFLAARGHGVGGSLLERDQVDTCQRLLAESGDKIILPSDVVVAERIADDAETRVVPAGGIPAGWLGLDIGPDSVLRFAGPLGDAGTVFWNGPMGVFEHEPFAGGTRGVAEAIAGSSAFSVVGGGDSAAAIRQLDLDESRFSHISTGGGASLEFIEGRQLPGISVLED
ncbi:MAG TPA: phosphoglycerate kinase [Pseudonocardiaceae bacterium]|nr:phosphoglycerate kinase [Pseudonocardiaceae bacterium]